MYVHHVLVIQSGHPGCPTVVEALESMPDVYVVGTPGCLPEAEAIAKRKQPRLVVTPDEVAGERSIPFLHRLRPHVHQTQFLVACDDYRLDELLLVSEASITCFLYWSDLLADLLEHLRVAISARTTLLSNNIAAAHLAAERYRQQDDGLALDVSVRDIKIRRGLIEGLTRREIANQLGVGTRTVERTIEQLRETFDAPCAEAVIMKAAQRGLIP